MDDDFNTADAISAVFELVKLANTSCSGESSKEFVKTICDEIILLSEILGLIVHQEEELLDTDIEKLIQDRQAARKSRDFAKADEIRDTLLSKGIILEDTREGVRWKRS
jgi:cysteinyl-tRNA synthetase